MCCGNLHIRIQEILEIVFILMDLNMSPTFKQLLQAKIDNPEKKVILSVIQCKKN